MVRRVLCVGRLNLEKKSMKKKTIKDGKLNKHTCFLLHTYTPMRLLVHSFLHVNNLNDIYF